MNKQPKFKAGKRCPCGCGRRIAAVFFKNGQYYGSWDCANIAHRMATEPHDVAPDGIVRFRHIPSVAELQAMGLNRLAKEGFTAERWLLPSGRKGGKNARFYVNRFRGELITT